MYDLLKPVPKEVVQEESIPAIVEAVDNTEAMTLAMQLRVTIPALGDRVRVTSDSVFDAGKIGTVSKIAENITIKTDDDEIVIAEHKQVERLVIESDLITESLDLAFTGMYKAIMEGLKNKGVDLNIVNELVLESINEFVVDHTYKEVTQANFANSVVDHVLMKFPRMTKGIVELPKRFNLINAALADNKE